MVDKQLYSLRTAGLVHNFHYESQIYPSSNDPATMVLRFPSRKYCLKTESKLDDLMIIIVIFIYLRLSFEISISVTELFGDIMYQVTSTDYTGVSLVYSCKSSVFGHLETHLILSRTPSLNLQVIAELNKALQVRFLTLNLAINFSVSLTKKDWTCFTSYTINPFKILTYNE